MNDIIVIGAGIAGLTTAALLARAGYSVLVLEGHIEPGGCASSYERKRPDGSRYVFDVGATLFAGFQPGGAHHWVADHLKLTWPVRPLEPAMEVWLPDERITRWGDQRWESERQRAFGPGGETFWRTQQRDAEIAWRFAARLPPLPCERPNDLLELASCIRPELAWLAPHLLRTVAQRMHGLGVSERRLRTFVDAQLLISSQTTAAYASWLYGCVALDFARIGAHYVEGGAWSLAHTLVASLERDGGSIRYRTWVQRILTRAGRVCGVETAHGERINARWVIANTTHWDVTRLLGEQAAFPLVRHAARSQQGWGAVMLYLGVAEEAIPPGMAEHHQIVASYEKPLGEANSVFISIHPPDDQRRAPPGQRAVTISTHTDVGRWWQWRTSDPARYRAEKHAMGERLLDSASIAMPHMRRHIQYQQIGTPVSFQRYTRRYQGMVGGMPQTPWTAGFFSRGPGWARVANLLMVGDSTFPGQSTAAVTQSAIRAYLRVVRG